MSNYNWQTSSRRCLRRRSSKLPPSTPALPGAAPGLGSVFHREWSEASASKDLVPAAQEVHVGHQMLFHTYTHTQWTGQLRVAGTSGIPEVGGSEGLEQTCSALPRLHAQNPVMVRAELFQRSTRGHPDFSKKHRCSIPHVSLAFADRP